MQKQPVRPPGPAGNVPYTPGIIIGDLVFVSGQIPMDMQTREVLRGDFAEEVRLCIHNVERVLKAAGTTLEHCVKVTVYLQNMDNFSRLNEIYGEYFGEVKPARTCIQVARLPLDAEVEIEAIATLP